MTWGIPGPGGSMGRCAICGETFIGGVVKDLCGLPSGITEFSVGWIQDRMCLHEPDCRTKIEEAMEKASQARDIDALAIICAELPEKSPLREASEAIIRDRTT